jgi:hypothetical protein
LWLAGTFLWLAGTFLGLLISTILLLFLVMMGRPTVFLDISREEILPFYFSRLVIIVIQGDAARLNFKGV